MDCSLLGFLVYGIFLAWILEWVAISFSRGSSWPRDQTWVSHIVGRCFTIWATREALSEWVKSLSRVWLFATPWTVTHQASTSMGSSRQGYWSGLPFPSPWQMHPWTTGFWRRMQWDPPLPVTHCDCDIARGEATSLSYFLMPSWQTCTSALFLFFFFLCTWELSWADRSYHFSTIFSNKSL